MMRATIACRHMEGIVRVIQKPENRRKIWKSIFALLPRKQKSGFFLILLILAVSAALSRLTPLAVGYLTDHVLAGQNASFASVSPILAAILAVNIVNELQGGATADRGGYRRPGGKNRAPAGRALAADDAAVLFPRPHDRQHPRPSQPESGRHGEADQADGTSPPP